MYGIYYLIHLVDFFTGIVGNLYQSHGSLGSWGNVAGVNSLSNIQDSSSQQICFTDLGPPAEPPERTELQTLMQIRCGVTVIGVDGDTNKTPRMVVEM